jgi:hypothetical protein
LSRIAVGLVLAASLLAPLGAARAQEAAACGTHGGPWISLVGDAWPAPFDGAFRSRLVEQLAAGLSARHIGLCVAPGGARPADRAASEVAITVVSGDAITVSVTDAVTDKRLVREIALATVPLDARPLTVALAVDELLRASWLELALPDAPAPTRPVAPEIAALAAAGHSATREWELGAALAAERFGGGTRQAGVDVVVRAALARPLWLHTALGLRKAADVRAADGVVRATVVGAELGAGAELGPSSSERRWRLTLTASGRLLHADISGEPRADAHGGEATATAIYVCAGLRGAVRLGRSFGLTLAAGFGAPLRGVDLLDGGTRVGGLSGPMLSLALGATWQVL